MNHQDIVQRVKDQSPPFTSADVMLSFVLNVLAALPPEEHAGLVKAPPGGENVAFYQGIPVRVNRVIYPDGQIIKILTDSGVGGTNGAAWNMDDVRPDLYLAVPNSGTDIPNPGTPPVQETCLFTSTELLEQLNALRGQVAAQHLAQAKSFEVLEGLVRQVLAKQDRALEGNTKVFGGRLVLRPQADPA